VSWNNLPRSTQNKQHNYQGNDYGKNDFAPFRSIGDPTFGFNRTSRSGLHQQRNLVDALAIGKG
jgi:hypothetical protein